MPPIVYSTFSQPNLGLGTASDSANQFTLAMQFSLSQNAGLTGIWWYSPNNATIIPTQCGIFSVANQALIASNLNPTWSGSAGAGWIKCSFDGVFQLVAGNNYQVAIYTPNVQGFYAATANYWRSGGIGANGLTSGIITAPNNNVADVGQDSFIASGGGLNYPTDTFQSTNYWLDVEVTTGHPSAVSPVPGFAQVSPRTWSTGDIVSTPRLRASIYNAAALMGQARPMYGASADFTISANVVTPQGPNSPTLNTWSVLLTENNGVAQFYPVPLPGWYLLQGEGGLHPVSGGASNTQYAWGFYYTQGTAQTAYRTELGRVAGAAGGNFTGNIGNSGGELIPMTPASSDLIATYAFTTNGAGASCQTRWVLEWVGLPSSAFINNVPYSGPVGTAIASPKPASLWPPGPGVTLQGTVSSGGTVVVLPPTPGLRTGQTIGLDWQNGVQVQAFAETATVGAIAGGSVSLTSALLYGHSAGAPVAVPVSAPFMNEQVRDITNTLFYPPMLRAVQPTGSVQSVTTATWTTISLVLSGTGVTNTIDNYSRLGGHHRELVHHPVLGAVPDHRAGVLRRVHGPVKLGGRAARQQRHPLPG